MKKFLIIIISYVLTLSVCALETKDILKLSKLAHDGEIVHERMKIFTMNRVYRVSYTITHPKDAPEGNPIAMSQKFVDKGKFHISEFRVGEGESVFDIIKVSTYDIDKLIYRQWVLNKQMNKVVCNIGIRLNGENTIAWSSSDSTLTAGYYSLLIEKYSEDEINWSNRDYIDGKLIVAMEGFAKSADPEAELNNLKHSVEEANASLEKARENAREALSKAIKDLQQELE